MKKTVFSKWISLFLALTLLISSLVVFNASASEEANTKTVEIISNNVYYGDTLKLMYAVKAENLTSDDSVVMKLYDGENNEIETITSYKEQTVNGESCYVFTSAYGVPEQNIDKVIYAKAQIVMGDTVSAETALVGYSVLEYLYERLTVSKEAGKVSAEQEELYEGLVSYAGLCEKVLTDKASEDKISNYSYVSVVNGTLDGTEKAATYKKGTVINTFSHTLGATSYTVIWQIDKYDKSGNYIDSYAVTDSELQANGYTVTDDNVVITAKVNGITAEECYAQVGTFGNTNNAWGTVSRASVRYAIPVKPGAKVIFSGDTSVYKYAIYLSDNPENVFITGTQNYDSGWQTGKEYVISQDKYPTTEKTVYLVLVVARHSGNLTQSEVEQLAGYFTIDGEKASVLADRGILTDFEYNSQPAHWGSAVASNVTTNTRMRISFTVKMQAGTKVSFVGDKSAYNWAVVETFNTAGVDHPVDTGWNSNWADPDSDYYTVVNGSYLVLTLRKTDNTAFSADIIDTLHTMFKVEGQKYVDGAKSSSVTQQSYTVNSVNHRGFGTAPENTLEAYRLSAHNGFNMVECDVSFTSDGYAVLLHDDTIDRTSNGSGSISSMTLAEVRQYDFGSWKSQNYAGAKIPTFDEFIALCVELNLHPYIEIKGNIDSVQAQNLVSIVDKYGLLNNCTWISFSATSLSAVLQYDEDARVGYVTSGISEDIINTALSLKNGKNSVFIDTYFSYVTSDQTENVALVQNAGLGLEVYTVNYWDRLAKLHSYVSGVTSDYLIAGKYLG